MKNHRAKNFFGDRSRNSGHWGDEAALRKWRHGPCRPLRDHAARRDYFRSRRAAQQRQLPAKFIKYRRESLRRRFVGGISYAMGPKRFDDQIDRPIVEMQTLSICKHSNHGRLSHLLELSGSELLDCLEKFNELRGRT
jgi:hypothetical protein